ncbi:hypothetical protein appser2_5770 [Actinobacillus pleuropneumoniae serovar 2 str. S1536]|nr:hypothetical protein appser2_5770 [Actinobacillus pleuropneumoniae serovar 2 str. S1536]EFM90240.1 hypothetical protein appser4_6120 [Actinobacillus pleuropneumoniae serovar 4 str. M62]
MIHNSKSPNFVLFLISVKKLQKQTACLSNYFKLIIFETLKINALA